jgi:hypothetical protein
MFGLLTRHWWMVALCGVLAILFGLATFLWPALSMAVLVLLFGAYARVCENYLSAPLILTTPLPRPTDLFLSPPRPHVFFATCRGRTYCPTQEGALAP